MNKSAFSLIPLLILSAMLFVACQNSPAAPPSDADTNPESVSAPVVSHGQPFSNGPTVAPENAIVGPSAPPSEDSNATPAQAVTTDENIRITLPRKTE